MVHKSFVAGLFVVSTLAFSSMASAVTLSNSGATPGTIPNGLVAGFFEDVAGGGLAIDGPAKVLFTYSGSAAAFNNVFLFNASTLFTTSGSIVGATANGVVTGAGLLNFSYLSNLVDPLANGQGSLGPEMIAFQLVSATEANIFFNDNFPDFNFADMTINVKVSPVPLPGALPLLAAGLTGVCLMGRRRRRKSA